MEDSGAHEETPKREAEFRNFDEEDYTSHRNVYVSVHMPYGRKHHHRHHRHRHHKKKHSHGTIHHSHPSSSEMIDYAPPSSEVAPCIPVNPCDRVKFILGEEEPGAGAVGNNCSNGNLNGCSSRQLFTEMDELCCYPDNRMEWKETARWIKFEEDLEQDADRWSKPHVATLSLHSLFELRSCVLRGSVQLDLDAENLFQIVDLVLDNLVANNHLDEEYRLLVRDALLQPHYHRSNSHLGLRRSNNQAHYGEDSKGSSPVMSRQTSVASELRRNSSIPSLRPIKSLLNSLQLREEGVAEQTEEGVANRHYKVDQHVMRKLPSNAEASNVLVGEVDTLPHTVIAFIRLANSVLLGDLTEVPIPTRFIFVLLGPLGNRARYHEVGRSISTLMSDPVFHDVAYKAKCREDLLAGIDEFMDKVTVLPPGEWDPQIRIEPPENVPSPTTRVATVANSVGGESPKQPRKDSIVAKQSEELVNFQCEKRPFSGLVHDWRRWRSRFFSDVRDAFHWHSLAAILLLFIVTLTLAISLGEELSELTNNEMGIAESLLASSFGNLLTPLFGGQPLVVMVASRSTLVLDRTLYNFCSTSSVPFLAFRFWVGFWTMLLLLLLVAINASGILLVLTRFTLELFSVVLSIVFISFVAARMWDIHRDYAHSNYLLYPINKRTCDCYHSIFNSTDNSTELELVVGSNCTADDKWIGNGCPDSQKPDVFFLSVILLLGTFLTITYLKKFYHSPFLTTTIRSVVSKFAVPTSLVIWTVVDLIAHEDVPSLPIKPNHYLSNARGLIVNPFGESYNSLPWWAVFAAIIPAIIATFLISVQHMVTSHFINKKLKKGRGYHLDLLLASGMTGLSGVFGFPWILAALVPSLAHIDILALLSPVKQVQQVREQRVTGLVVGILLAVSVVMEPALGHLPLPVLYGVLLAVGVSSLFNVQLVQRVGLLFIADKHKPDCCYVRSVPNRKIHFFTFLQLALLVFMCLIVFSPAIFGLPFVVAMVALIRWLLLGSLFTTKQLEILDDPLIKLNCLPQQRQKQPISVATCPHQPPTSQDSLDGVEDSINISVEMDRCDLWRHLSYSRRSPPPPIRISSPTVHQCTAV